VDDQEHVEGAGILLFTIFWLVLGPTQPSIQWERKTLSLGEKWLGHEADHSPPYSAEVKTVWSYTSTHPSLSDMVINYAYRFVFMV